jgi:hypothetical protein
MINKLFTHEIWQTLGALIARHPTILLLFLVLLARRDNPTMAGWPRDQRPQGRKQETEGRQGRNGEPIKVGSRRAESRYIVSAFCFSSSSLRSASCNNWLRRQISLAFLSSEVRRRVSETPPEGFNIIPLGVLSFEVPRARPWPSAAPPSSLQVGARRVARQPCELTGSRGRRVTV